MRRISRHSHLCCGSRRRPVSRRWHSAARSTPRRAFDGRWPEMRSQGSLTLKDGRLGEWQLERATARWTVGTQPQAPLDLNVELTQGHVGARRLDSLTLTMQGTTAEHRIAIDASSPVRPPSWVDILHGAARGATPAGGTRAQLRAKAALKFDLDWQQPAQWSLQLQQFQAARRGSDLATPWFSAKGFDLIARYDPLTHSPQLDVSAGRAELTNLALRWSALRWRGGETPALDVQAEVEPFSVAPLMARMQPEFGWNGDLIVGGKIAIHSAPTFVADIEFGRRSGDLSVTDEVETHKLELTDLRIALDAKDGVWHFTHALAGRTLGAMAGAATLRTNARAIWPSADAPLQGVMELRIDDLGAWGAWVPAGWRLRGALHASASFGGRFGAPEFTGKIEGSRLGLRNLLDGIDLSDGELEIALQGESARIVKLQARGGDGKLEVTRRCDLRRESADDAAGCRRQAVGARTRRSPDRRQRGRDAPARSEAACRHRPRQHRQGAVRPEPRRRADARR